jgi:type II secretion system protein G
MFKLDNSKYPSTEQGLAALVQPPTDPSIRHWRPGGYLEHVSKDPWGGDYHYENPGTHGKEYDLYTLGADDQPGGEGSNADIWLTARRTAGAHTPFSRHLSGSTKELAPRTRWRSSPARS